MSRASTRDCKALDGFAWMAGSSPVMTILSGVVVLEGVLHINEQPSVNPIGSRSLPK
jgi:hypothetical protein